MIQDLHLHSDYSDGKNSLRDMVNEAIRLGISEISFVDHVRKNSEWVDLYITELESLQREYAPLITIHIGVETKLTTLSGELDIDNRFLSKGIRIVAAIHKIPKGNGEYIKSSDIASDVLASKLFWLESFKALAKNSSISCLAHPFSMLENMGVNKHDTDWWNQVSSIMNTMPFSFEYNVKYNNNIVPEWIWEKYADKIVFGTDSHSIIDLANRYDELVGAQLELICCRERERKNA